MVRYHKHCKTTEKCTHIYQTVCSQAGYEQTCSQASCTLHTLHTPCCVPGALADVLPRDSVP